VAHSSLVCWKEGGGVVSQREVKRKMGLLFPREISQQAEDRKDHAHDPEDGRGEEAGDDAVVFCREAKLRCYSAIDWNECQPDDHGTWNCKDCVFRPNVRYQCRFSQHGCENGGIQCCAPDPVTSDLAITLNKIVIPDELRDKVCH